VPARHSPQMGFEGANVIFDTWVHPLMMGLEEHLLHMFKDDFEFGDGATPSHLHASPSAAGAERPARAESMGAQRLMPFSTRAALALEAPEAASAVGFAEEEDEVDAVVAVASIVASWIAPAEAELKKIPFFVRGKVRRNTEKYAHDNGIAEITVDVMYEAKAFYGR
jgi:light-independent protochlorophyllide reductase subunit B